MDILNDLLAPIDDSKRDRTEANANARAYYRCNRKRILKRRSFLGKQYRRSYKLLQLNSAFVTFCDEAKAASAA